jgi:hypothetical protein
MQHIEIKQQSRLQAGETEICKQLRRMHRHQLLNSFDLDDDLLGDQESIL